MAKLNLQWNINFFTKVRLSYFIYKIDLKVCKSKQNWNDGIHSYLIYFHPLYFYLNFLFLYLYCHLPFFASSLSTIFIFFNRTIWKIIINFKTIMTLLSSSPFSRCHNSHHRLCIMEGGDNVVCSSKMRKY
jgi:hypothetical protein